MFIQQPAQSLHARAYVIFVHVCVDMSRSFSQILRLLLPCLAVSFAARRVQNPHFPVQCLLIF